MSGLFMLNFGTTWEATLFKHRAVGGNYVSSDAMDRIRPGGMLDRRGGVQLRYGHPRPQAWTLHGLRATTWRRTFQGKRFREVFASWMESVVDLQPECVVLAGHHAGKSLWARDVGVYPYFRVSLREKHRMHFNLMNDTGNVSHSVPVGISGLQKECRLVVGLGCNIASPSESHHYQRIFGAGGEKPVVLGWDATISLPRYSKDDERSIIGRFFDEIDVFVAGESGAPAERRFRWLHANHSMELVRAWGMAVHRYRRATLGQWARARDKDGTAYRFRFTATEATPVRA